MFGMQSAAAANTSKSITSEMILIVFSAKMFHGILEKNDKSYAFDMFYVIVKIHSF
jgi:hypothetical protein